eukprot:4941171-Prymnesium_polylepis.1
MPPRRAAITSVIAFFRRAAPEAPRGGVAAPCDDDAREVFVPFTDFLDPVDGVSAGHRAPRRGSASISKNGV